jgi:hypothetical protein
MNARSRPTTTKPYCISPRSPPSPKRSRKSHAEKPPARKTKRSVEIRLTSSRERASGGLRGEPQWRDRAVSGSFRLRLPYHYPESGGADLRVALRSTGAVALESVALVPPSEPENVLRPP